MYEIVTILFNERIMIAITHEDENWGSNGHYERVNSVET